MALSSGLQWIFDSEAEKYEKMRPGYVPEVCGNGAKIRIYRYKLSALPQDKGFTAEEYTALLGTYSDHIAIEEQKRRKFFSEIERAIHHSGGQITLFDTIDLELARKP